MNEVKNWFFCLRTLILFLNIKYFLILLRELHENQLLIKTIFKWTEFERLKAHPTE